MSLIHPLKIDRKNIKRLKEGMNCMQEIYFQPVNSINEKEVRKIKGKPEQAAFIESVDECLAEAAQHSEWRPVAIYWEGVVVGFAMYGSFGPNRDTWIDRIIIDEKFQGRGLGKKAMAKLMEVVAEEYQVDRIHLSFVEENVGAAHLYRTLGFQYLDEKDPNGELIYYYDI